MTSVLAVGVMGAYGRMGAEVCRAVDAEDDLRLVGRVGRGDSLAGLAEARVAVDFTTPQSVKENVLWCVEHSLDVVVGTSGLNDSDLAEVESRAQASGSKVFVAPNFAVGAVLMMRFAALAAPFFDAAEIVERHHERKLDAPSGTALRTAHLLSEARSHVPAIAPGQETLAGSRGGDARGVRIHSLRLPGSIAHQEVVLGSPGETLTIRHDSVDRASFMPGVLLAVRRVGSLTAPLTVGLEHLLELGP